MLVELERVAAGGAMPLLEETASEQGLVTVSSSSWLDRCAAPPDAPRQPCSPPRQGKRKEAGADNGLSAESVVTSPMYLLEGYTSSSMCKEERMPKYLVQSRLAPAGVQGLLKEGGAGRRAAIEKTAASVGGKVEAYYYAFGQTDLFIILDMPDNVSMAAASLVANASGASTVSVTVLLTVEEIDTAAKMHPSYRPPGQ